MSELTCRELIEFLMDYLENELEEAQRTVFDEHLSICPACVRYMETYQEAVRLGRLAVTCEDEPVPEEVPDRLVQAILEARRKAR